MTIKTKEILIGENLFEVNFTSHLKKRSEERIVEEEWILNLLSTIREDLESIPVLQEFAIADLNGEFGIICNLDIPSDDSFTARINVQTVVNEEVKGNGIFIARKTLTFVSNIKGWSKGVKTKKKRRRLINVFDIEKVFMERVKEKVKKTKERV